MLRRILKQYNLPWIGGFKETLTQVAFWVSIINFGLIAVTAYHTTIRLYVAWLNFPLFMAVLILLVLIGLVIEYKFIVPAIWAFRGKQMFEHESELTKRIEKILERLEEQDKGKNDATD